MLFTGVVSERVPAEVWSPISAEERPDAGPDVPLIVSPSHPFASLQQSPEFSQTLHNIYDPPYNTKKVYTISGQSKGHIQGIVHPEIKFCH